MANQLTVIIPCKDEAHNIRACVESVRGLADEILVADSGSTDGTLDIVRQMGDCRLVEREFIDHSNFKNWAIQQATHPWVLIVDADERVTPKLAAEIRGVLDGQPAVDAYRIRRENYFLGHRIKRSGWNSATVTRLFRRAVCRYDNKRVHEDVIVETGRVKRLSGRFLHYTCQDLHEYLARINRYTTWSAEDMYAAGRRSGYLGLLLRPPARFLQFYIVRRGFLDGSAGLAVCLTMAFYTFMKYAKLWALGRAAADSARSPNPQLPRPAADAAPRPTSRQTAGAA
jgi:(heptosyl)LPS beta-1,4-glucosyltransferase